MSYIQPQNSAQEFVSSLEADDQGVAQGVFLLLEDASGYPEGMVPLEDISSGVLGEVVDLVDLREDS